MMIDFFDFLKIFNRDNSIFKKGDFMVWFYRFKILFYDKTHFFKFHQKHKQRLF